MIIVRTPLFYTIFSKIRVFSQTNVFVILPAKLLEVRVCLIFCIKCDPVKILKHVLEFGTIYGSQEPSRNRVVVLATRRNWFKNSGSGYIGWRNRFLGWVFKGLRILFLLFSCNNVGVATLPNFTFHMEGFTDVYAFSYFLAILILDVKIESAFLGFFTAQSLIKHRLSNLKLVMNLNKTLMKQINYIQPKIHRKIHTSLCILKISRKKSANQKSRDFCQIFVISNKKNLKAI